MSDLSYKNITAEEFSKLDFQKVTLVDLREPDELAVDQSAGYIFLKHEVHANEICTFLCTFCWQNYADICQYLKKYVL